MDDEKLPSNAEADKNAANEIYVKQVPSSIIIDRNHTVSYYINLCAIILRTRKGLIISGSGNSCDIAVSVVYALTKRKLGELMSIRTGMDISAHFIAAPNAQWTQPLAMMTFHVMRGEYAKYISGFRQMKIIELFEKNDPNVSGYLTIDKVKSFKLWKVFQADSNQKEKAKKYLTQLYEKQLQEEDEEEEESEQKLNLPEFIIYSSLLIHPLLKTKIFNDALRAEFNIV